MTNSQLFSQSGAKACLLACGEDTFAKQQLTNIITSNWLAIIYLLVLLLLEYLIYCFMLL